MMKLPLTLHFDGLCRNGINKGNRNGQTVLDQKCYCFLDKHRNALFLGQAQKYFCFLDKHRNVFIFWTSR